MLSFLARVTAVASRLRVQSSKRCCRTRALRQSKRPRAKGREQVSWDPFIRGVAKKIAVLYFLRLLRQPTRPWKKSSLSGGTLAYSHHFVVRWHRRRRCHLRSLYGTSFSIGGTWFRLMPSDVAPSCFPLGFLLSVLLVAEVSPLPSSILHSNNELLNQLSVLHETAPPSQTLSLPTLTPQSSTITTASRSVEITIITAATCV